MRMQTSVRECIRQHESAYRKLAVSKLVMQAEGSLWRGLGMLVAGGGLRSAVLLLRKVGMPDCAQALAQAAAEAQLDNKQGSADAGKIQICKFTLQA